MLVYRYVDYFFRNTHVYILLRKSNPCLTVIRRDVRCGNILGKTQHQVFPWMSYLFMKVLVSFYALNV